MSAAIAAADVAVEQWIHHFVLPLARSYRDGWRRPKSSWSATGTIFDAQPWSDADFERIILASTDGPTVVWVNTHESPFTFPADPLVGDLPTEFLNAFSVVTLSQSKERKSGVWKTRDGEFKDRRVLRFPYR